MKINAVYFFNLTINFLPLVLPLTLEFNSDKRNRGNNTQQPRLNAERVFDSLSAGC